MQTLALVGMGGFLGAVLRYLLSATVQRWTGNASFPYGTLAVNLLGCLLIGLFSQLAESRNTFTSETRSFIFVGILGAFTTFSTFGNETMQLLRNGETALSLVNIGTQLVFGLAAVWLGYSFGQTIWR